MTTLNESLHTGEYLLSEAPLYRSREVVSIASGQAKLKPGTILTKSAEATGATLVATAKGGGNTGNGAFTADPSAPVGASAKAGTYTATVTVAGTNSATFRVSDPTGAVLGDFSYSGSGAVGSFNNQIKFTITDGSTDFVVGDSFNIVANFANGADTYAAAALGGNADAVLYQYTDATSAATKATAHVRDCEVFGEFLVFPASATDTQKRDLVESFARKGIIVRWTNPPTA
jgi:hypothetical protein